MSQDYYKILGVEKGASDEEIKKSYRKLVKETHPDRNPDDKNAEEKFKEISNAYETLSDPEKRRAYDMYGSSGNPFGSGNGHYSHGFNMEDLFSQFGDIFGGGGGFGGGRRSQPKGSDLRIKIQLTLHDILNGVKKKIKFKRSDKCSPCNGEGGTDKKTCPGCNGSGFRTIVQNSAFGQIRKSTQCNSCGGSGSTISNKCSTCKGSGSFVKEEIIDIDVPVGVSDGMVLTMSQYGNYIKGGTHGDLQIFVEEIPDPIWKRDRNNIKGEVEITLLDAILGKKMDIDTPHGKMSINIDEGTQSGKIIKISYKGVPDVNYGLGDLFIIINVKIPKVNLEEKVILEKLRSSNSFK